MGDENKNSDFILGQILGEMKGMNASVGTLASALASHTLSDEKNFSNIREQMAKDKEEMNTDRVRIAKITGGIIILATIASYLAPSIIGRL
jgi:hypothetical protein